MSMAARRLELKEAKSLLARAEGPSRALDGVLANLLPAEAKSRTNNGGWPVTGQAFTRSVEHAERFVKLALPDVSWSVGCTAKVGDYYGIIWTPDDYDFHGEGRTPALAIISAAISIMLDRE